MTKIPLDEALPLVRDFGLLVNQAAIYGVDHRIIQEQAVAFYNRLHTIAKAHERIEFSIKGDKLAVNGEAEGMDPMSTRNLKERMAIHKLPGIFFSAQLKQDDFLSFLGCLAKPPVRVQEMGGFEQVLKESNIKGVSLVHFVYERVDTATSKNGVPSKKGEEKQPPGRQQKSSPKRTYDILEEGGQEGSSSGNLAKEVTRQAGRARQRVQMELDSLLNDVTQLVGHEDDPKDARMIEKLRSIRHTLRTSTETSKERITTFLGPLPEEKTASDASRARENRVNVLDFRHSEYMSRFAELTQEIVQPLTITNSVIELLGKGQAGPLTETQMEFINLALESVDRVNQLIKYMHTLYGEPDSYIPDAGIIQETYK
jgi:hypothetical protein